MPPFLPAAAPLFLPRLKAALVGLARDFWKDGDWSKPAKPDAAPALWQADRARLEALLWGMAGALPGDGLLQQTCSAHPDWLAGGARLDLSEPAAAAAPSAADGYALVMTHAVQRQLAADAGYLAMVAGLVKAGGRLLGNDYALEPEQSGQPAIAAWLAHEGLAIADLKAALAAAGLTVEAEEDQTAAYRAIIIQALERLAGFLRRHKPDPATRILIAAEVERWGRCIGALDKGLQFRQLVAVKG